MEASDLYNLFPLVCLHNYQHTLFVEYKADRMLLALTLTNHRSLNALSKID